MTAAQRAELAQTPLTKRCWVRHRTQRRRKGTVIAIVRNAVWVRWNGKHGGREEWVRPDTLEFLGLGFGTEPHTPLDHEVPPCARNAARPRRTAQKAPKRKRSTRRSGR